MRTTWILLLLLAFSLGGLVYLSIGPAEPQIVVASPTVDFGLLEPGERVVKTVEIANHGRAPLVIDRVRVACGCASVRLQDNVVPPRGRVALRMELTALGAGSDKEIDMLILSNDSHTPQQAMVMRYDVKRETPLQQREVHFGRVLRTSLPQTRSILYHCDRADQERLLGALVAVTDLKFLELRTAPHPAETGIDIEVKLSPNAPDGEILSDLWVREGSDPAAKQSLVKIMGYVRGDLVAVPSVAQVGKDHEETVAIQSRSGAGELEIVDLELTNEMRHRLNVDNRGIRKGQRLELGVKLSQDMEANRGSWLLGTIVVSVKVKDRVTRLAIPVVCRKEL